MFREELQAFVVLPENAPNQKLRAAIEEALAQHGVKTRTESQEPNTPPAVAAQDLLRDSDFVIADITGANPNVMYEVGMAQGLGKRVLLLSSERSSALPFDLAAQQVAVYQPESVGSVRKYLDLWLRDAISEGTSSVD